MRSTLLRMLTCWLVLGSAGTARGDDTQALIRCARAVEHCELDLKAAQDALKKANDAAADERAEADARTASLKAALLERDEAEDGARGKATAAWALGVAGTVLEAGAVAVLLAGGSTTIAAALAGVGAAGAAAGITVAVW